MTQQKHCIISNFFKKNLLLNSTCLWGRYHSWEASSFLLIVSSIRAGLLSLFSWIFIENFFFSFLWPYLRHMEVPRPGVKLELQLRPMLQPQQHQMWTTSETYAAAWASPGSLTHWARPGIKPTSSQRQHWALNPLSHSESSWNCFFKHNLKSSLVERRVKDLVWSLRQLRSLPWRRFSMARERPRATGVAKN